jgi:hypothetical protein
MRYLFVLATIYPSLVVAKAPVYAHNGTAAVPYNYIVALKPHLTVTKVNAYYDTLKAANSRTLADSGHRGVINTFDNVDYNAFHMECDNSTLDNIRDDPSVSP